MTLLHQTTATKTAESNEPSLSPMLPLVLFVAGLVMAYGYEIFSFGLTLDEERYGELDNVSYAARWMEERRWTMSLLTLLIPSPVVPVVSTGLGVALSGVAWWLLGRRYLTLSPWQASLACTLAGTMPVLAFIFSFSTIAFGIGVGNCLLIAYIRGLSSPGWKARGLGVLAGAAAVGIYDSFLVALAALSLALILKKPHISTIWLALGAPVLAILFARLVAMSASLVTGIPPGKYLDLYYGGESILSDPIGRVVTAVASVGKVVVLWEETFGLHSPWLSLALAVLGMMAIRSLLTSSDSTQEKLIGMASLGALILLPVMAGLVATSVPLRSMFYLPIVTLVLASIAFRGTLNVKPLVDRAARSIVAGLVIAAVVGNATISNRLYASAQTAYALDMQLAFLIGHEKDKLLAGNQLDDLAFVVSGRHSWPSGKLTPQVETIGASFFDWDGDDQRIGAFLRMHGVKVHDATPVQVERATAELTRMPVYPLSGWIRVSDGVLLIKFTEDAP